jgi:sugar lactone lactonase YvrE
VPVSRATIASIQPLWAIEGGRVNLHGGPFPVGSDLPLVRIGDKVAHVVFASSTMLGVLVPKGLEGGRTTVRIEGVAGETAFLSCGAVLATGLHQVDSPVFDADGNLYVTYSGSRGQDVPVSVYRVRPDGTRETFASGIVNPTSMAFDDEGRLYVSSRFDGTVYRLRPDGSADTVATDLGVTCGLAFADDGRLFVGDRTGTIFVIEADGSTHAFASLPPSVAAFHLAYGRQDGALYVTAPTLSAYDPLYRIDSKGQVEIVYAGFGRPQGLTFDPNGQLYVVDALAGDGGVYRMTAAGKPELALAGVGLIGIAFDRRGGFAVASNDTVYKFDL